MAPLSETGQNASSCLGHKSMTAARWIKYAFSVVLGNALYFLFARHLPAAARHQSSRVDIGLFIDLWICVAVYGLVELLAFVHSRRKER
jgi:hypothetical protein